MCSGTYQMSTSSRQRHTLHWVKETRIVSVPRVNMSSLIDQIGVLPWAPECDWWCHQHIAGCPSGLQLGFPYAGYAVYPAGPLAQSNNMLQKLPLPRTCFQCRNTQRCRLLFLLYFKVTYMKWPLHRVFSCMWSQKRVSECLIDRLRSC